MFCVRGSQAKIGFRKDQITDTSQQNIEYHRKIIAVKAMT